jgi:hypothetical protein
LFALGKERFGDLFVSVLTDHPNQEISIFKYQFMHAEALHLTEDWIINLFSVLFKVVPIVPIHKKLWWLPLWKIVR